MEKKKNSFRMLEEWKSSLLWMHRILGRGVAGEDLNGWEGDAGAEEPRSCGAADSRNAMCSKSGQGGVRAPGSIGFAGLLSWRSLWAHSGSATWMGRTGYLRTALPGPHCEQGAASAWQRNNWIFPQPKNSDINIVYALITTITRVGCGKKPD